MKNVILYHEDVDVMQRTADELLKKAFGEGYRNTPDFSVWDVSFGDGLDTLREKMEQFSYAPIDLAQTVVLIMNAERLSDGCQGAMLTELENEARCYVFCSRLPLIQTVESRCEVKRLPAGRAGAERWQTVIGTDDIPDGELQMLQQVVKAFRSDHRAFDILRAIGLYKEKDKDSFYSLYKEDVFRIFRVLRKLYTEEFEHGILANAERIRVCSNAEAKYLRVLPTANELNAALYTALA